MSFAQTVLLAGFPGVTIYLGLPVGRLRTLSANWQALLTAAARLILVAGFALHNATEGFGIAAPPARAFHARSASGTSPAVCLRDRSGGQWQGHIDVDGTVETAERHLKPASHPTRVHLSKC